MGQTVSSLCPCLSSDYTEIHDDSASSFIEKDVPKIVPLASTAILPGRESLSSQAVRGVTPASSSANREGATALLSALAATAPQASDRRSSNGGLAHIEFDLQSPVFKGSVVQQKFFNKSTYEAKFAWINLKSKALCLSEHTTKERRHKEASIADITGVISGPPEKFKAAVGQDGAMQSCDPDLCLSVKFIRGGGIDLKFPTTRERDEWADVILRMIQGLKKQDISSDNSVRP